ncbi:MAG: hypothetical protein LC620_03800, partial [Halobacteriales archaeon]|nr:hypothetical protein [Halobacteriales archaeon]
MATTATKTGLRNEMVYEDPVVTDTLFGPVVRGIFWTGFGVLAAARVAIGITTLVIWSKLSDLLTSKADPNGLFATLGTQQTFVFIEGLGALLFASGFVVAALVASRMAEWARITLLSVAGLLLVGSSALASFNLLNLLSSG